MNQLLTNAQTFVRQVLIPDVLAVAGFYRDWFEYGEGLGNFMAYGDYPSGSIHDPAGFTFPRGIILNRDLSTVHPLDTKNVTEYVTHSWYEYSEGDQVGKHPAQGETKPKYSGPKPPYEFLNVDEKYSWLKSPRYDDKPMEVGPLARTLVAYASGNEQIKKRVDAVLSQLNLPPTALFSTMGRIAARALEAEFMADKLTGWIQELSNNMGHGNLRIHDNSKWDPDSWPKSCQGFGLEEAPRDRVVDEHRRACEQHHHVRPQTIGRGTAVARSVDH